MTSKENIILQYLKSIYIKICNKIGFMILIKDQRKSIHSNELKKYNTETGTYFLPKYAYQDVIKNEIIKNRIFDEEIFNFGKKLIKEDSIVIDAGANFGQMSILFSRVKNNVEVHSFEASPFIYEILKKNVLQNNSNIKTFNLVLSDKSESNSLKDPELKFGTYGADNLEFTENFLDNKKIVKSIKIDDLKFNKKISFMKIDVQGMDYKVLVGAKKTIEKNKMPIVFEYEDLFEKKFDYNFEMFVNFVKDIDYKFQTVVKQNFLILPK